MAKKQWKIGEWAIGGIIAVEIKNQYVTIKCLDWDTKEEVRICHFSEDDKEEMQSNLWDMTSSYYTDQIMKWIKENTPKTEMA